MTKLPVSAAAFALLLGGCFWATTKSEGQALRKDVTVLQQQLSTKQQALDEQIDQLKKVLDDATKLLKRNSADLGLEVEQLRTSVREATGLSTTVTGQINDLRLAFEAYKKANDARLDAIEQRLAQLESGKPSSTSSADDLWRLGSAAFEAGRYNDAIDIFKRLTQTYPTHERADDALYFRGQAYTNLKDWEKAIAIYQQLVDKYPDSPFADDGLYFAALAAQQLKQCTEARTYLSIIKSKYPKSNVAKQAAELDAVLKKDAKNKAKCSA
ncbi:MAG TPA: tetratricopeptide repeat protein [Kofleriaceae bacterium]|nr:tetratricopeptide repeat protein [Kofleriaceae bacterium]